VLAEAVNASKSVIIAPHIHVERANNTAKFWLDPIRLQRSRRFRRNEINRIQKLIEEHREHLLRSWDEYFND
jgi:Domain of unknown function (DUF4160)